MARRYNFVLIICISIIFLFTACEKRAVDLSNIRKPDSIILIGNYYKEEIKALTKDYVKAKESNDTEAMQQIAMQIAEYGKAAAIKIEDRKFIDTVIDDIVKSKGYVISKLDASYLEMIIFSIELRYNINTSLEMMKEGYLPSVEVFDDGTILLPFYDGKSETISMFVKATISKETVDCIKNYYEEHKIKNN